MRETIHGIELDIITDHEVFSPNSVDVGTKVNVVLCEPTA